MSGRCGPKRRAMNGHGVPKAACLCRHLCSLTFCWPSPLKVASFRRWYLRLPKRPQGHLLLDLKQQQVVQLILGESTLWLLACSSKVLSKVPFACVDCVMKRLGAWGGWVQTLDAFGIVCSMQDCEKEKEHRHAAVDPTFAWKGLPRAPAPQAMAVRLSAFHVLCQQCQALAEHATALQQLADGPVLSLAAACPKLWMVVAVSLPWKGGQHHIR
mmetsp:Transcript_85365/g.169322  ORF Transcript_85365/g.169322 Transcript_85365/m.169322 type:complete len:214 (+) Transcript_85365:1508-2149(+)